MTTYYLKGGYLINICSIWKCLPPETRQIIDGGMLCKLKACEAVKHLGLVSQGSRAPSYCWLCWGTLGYMPWGPHPRSVAVPRQSLLLCSRGHPLCVPLCLPLLSPVRTLSLVLGLTQNIQGELISRSLITSAERLFPNKVTFACAGGEDLL